MVPVMSLWLPIMLSAVLVFVVSSIVHMMLTYHRGDHAKVAAEDEFMETMRRLNIAPGDYVVPHAGSSQAMKEPAFVEKMKKGPTALMTVMPGGTWNMGASLTQWFIYSLVVSTIAAYVAGRAVGPGGEYLSVFRFTGTTAFACYAMGAWQNSIWYKRKWSTTFKLNIDGLLYALVTAGTFGWLWPR